MFPEVKVVANSYHIVLIMRISFPYELKQFYLDHGLLEEPLLVANDFQGKFGFLLMIKDFENLTKGAISNL